MKNCKKINNPITIMHSVSSWLPQTETWLYNQVHYLPPDVDSHIVCESIQNLEQFQVPNIHSFSDVGPFRYLWDKGLRKIKVRPYLGFLVEQAKESHAQILHSHFGNIGWANIGVARKAGLKHVVTFYGYDVNMLPTIDVRWYDRYHQLFKQVDCVLCEGSHMAKCVCELGCPEEKVHVQHLGVRVEEIPFVPRIWNPGEPLKVLIAGSFREKKGIPYAIEALGRLSTQIPLEITIIGDASMEQRSQDEKTKILTMIRKYNLQSKVRLLGYQPHAVLFEEAYKNHILLSPSVTASDGDTEGGAPVTIIEMAATGMPIVSTKHCDIPEVIQNGVTGRLAEERDVKGLVEQLMWFINNPYKWEEMLVTGRSHIQNEYNAREQGMKLSTIYKEVCLYDDY